MSYRGLVSLVQGDDRRDYRIVLDEDFKNGEELCHVVANLRTFGIATTFLAGGVLGPARYPQSHWTAEERKEWIETWADQTWEVNFNPDAHEDGEDYLTTVRIEGFDAIGTAIFMRRTTYHIDK